MRLNHFLFSVLLFVMANATARAQSSMATSTVSTSQSSFSNSKFNGSFAFGGRSDFKETGAEDKSYTSEYEFTLGYQMDAENSLSFFIPFEKELSGAYEARVLRDARLSYDRADFYQYKNMNVSLKSVFVYPTSELSKVQNEMIAGVEFGPTFAFDLNKYATGLSFIYVTRYRRNFNKFTVDRTGQQLTEQSFLQFFVGNYSFMEKYAFQSAFIYVNSWRYDGAQKYDSYLAIQELSAQVTPKVNVALGIETSAALVNPERGESKGVQIFDKNLSQVYGKASVVF
ncbi:MAG: hypothetical protein CME64_00140 [Halobacteriovoraceae bacterium]|nr:hypothetical protein [Halobacteriovoraceae bacterium]|tara:strand:- start:33522 stop:34376 length:855 start_codon:yes stop_codon:yes gene_type:complete